MKLKKIASILVALLCACLFSTAALAAARDAVPADAKAATNPVDSEIDMKAAKKLYKSCKNCHGKKGNGKTAAAKDMPEGKRPPDWTQGSESTDGQLFWLLMNGVKDNDEMKSYKEGSSEVKAKKQLTEEKAWTLVHYIRAFAK